MKTKEIRDLIDFISKTGLNEVNIETEELKLSIKRNAATTTQIIEPSALTQVAIPTVSTVVQPSTTPSTELDSQLSEKVSESTDDTEGLIEIKSPMIGTFYRAQNPDSDPFVNVGDSIGNGKTVCIIEAMKLFNEIEAEVSGKIVKILAEDATPVEYDQPLFLVDPS
jgi:acetyl-CoA carboxylase biotin carboxyl carrier protein